MDIVRLMITELSSTTATVMVAFFMLCGVVVITIAMARGARRQDRYRHEEEMEKARATKLIEGHRHG